MKTSLIFILLIFQVLACREELLHTTTENIAGGSYKYYSLMHEGFVRIKLKSLTGDADLYVSQVGSKPTYEPSQYCLQSSTCGEDTVLIPSSFKRPVTVGVYGHPSHENSEYVITVYKTVGKKDLSYDPMSGDVCKDCESQDQDGLSLMSIAKQFLQLFLELLF